MPLSRNAEPLVQSLIGTPCFEDNMYAYLEPSAPACLPGKPEKKCRIPRRCSPSPGTSKFPSTTIATVTMPFHVRPKSAGSTSIKSQHDSTKSPAHSVKPSRNLAWSNRKQAPTKKSTNEVQEKSALKRNCPKRDSIMVPVAREAIKRLESKESPEENHIFPTLETTGSKTALSSQLKREYQEKMTQYQKFKKDLLDKQLGISDLYGRLRDIHNKMECLGLKIALPSNDDLCVMNPASMTPEQLLHICSVTRHRNDDKGDQIKTLIGENSFSIDFNKILRVPMSVIETCEQTLEKRNEIIQWLNKLMQSESKGIRMRSMVTKVNEFSAENQMLNGTLENLKSDFVKEATEISDCLRNGVKEAMALHLRIEEMTYEMSELNSQNADLRKQLHVAESLKPHSHRVKIEELDKELKEEKSKRLILRDRLARAEGQVKMGSERATQLEAALEQSRAQTWSLERTVDDLKTQNQRLQTNFETELQKFQSSIVENTTQLGAIDEAREKICKEKEELEKKIQELSDNYKDSNETMNKEMAEKVAALSEIEQKYKEEMEQKKIMGAKIESLCADLLKTEQRNGEITRILRENEDKIGEVEDLRNDLKAAKQVVNEIKTEAEEYKRQVVEKDELIKQIENKYNETRRCDETLKHDLHTKEELVSALEMKQSLLQKQLQDSEFKMESYESQLTNLKTQIQQSLEELGEFENLTNLHEMIKQQRSKLLEATRQNGELAEELQNKDVEIDQHVASLNEKLQIIEEKDSLIQMYSDKGDEQADIIKLLRHKLEIRANRDSDLNEKLADKDKEIESLVANVEKRKQQINEFENIVLALEEEIHSADLQRKSDRDNINALQKKIAMYESVHAVNAEAPQNTESAVELDYLIKILEDELGPPLDAPAKQDDFSRKKHAGDSRYDSLTDLRSCGNTNAVIYRREAGSRHPSYITEHQKIPTKIVMGNFVKKTYLRNDEGQKREDIKDKSFLKINKGKHKWSDVEIFENNTPRTTRGALSSKVNDINYLRNLDLLSYHLQEGKQSKMFKLAGHRL